MTVTKLSAQKDGWWKFRDALKDRLPFANDKKTLRGTTNWYGTGMLADEWLGRLTMTDTDFVVYSYATPIAWHETHRGWVMPPVKYSVTTSGHQGTILTALWAVDEWALDFQVPEHMGEFK